MLPQYFYFGKRLNVVKQLKHKGFIPLCISFEDWFYYLHFISFCHHNRPLILIKSPWTAPPSLCVSSLNPDFSVWCHPEWITGQFVTDSPAISQWQRKGQLRVKLTDAAALLALLCFLLDPFFLSLFLCYHRAYIPCVTGLIVVWYSHWKTAVICKIDLSWELVHEMGKKQKPEVEIMGGKINFYCLLFFFVCTDAWQETQSVNNYLIIVSKM